eukprot:2942504-Heterocapsa_arctica.AAC.1
MGVHDVQPKFGPFPMAVYTALNNTAHVGSYPWGAAVSNCGNERSRTSGWAQLGRQICKRQRGADVEGAIHYEA